MGNLVGMQSRVQKVKSLLQMESEDDVRIIGIWGMGGIGKTTIAQVVFQQISYYFEGSSFVENVRENASHGSGLVSLQEKVLSEILEVRDLKVKNVYEGINMMSTRLRQTRVLLVLDDVNDVKQLKALAATHDWFGPSSRIIVTTRDIHVLSGLEVHVYQPELLNEDQSLQLFSWHAFNSDSAPDKYEELSRRVVSHARCLPLALEVLGSYLCGEDVNFWEKALVSLIDIAGEGINKVLKLSYDGLSNFEKKIFLDIACFFKGQRKERVTKILDTFNFHPEIGIRVLIKKSLVTISNGNLEMHDLLVEMGQEIGRTLDGRLSRPQDIYDALTKNIVRLFQKLKL